MASDKSGERNFSRRDFLRLTLLTGAALPFFPKAVFGAQTAQDGAKKPLIVYFSESGNTKKIAEDIRKELGADIVRIEPVKAYPSNYDDLTAHAKKEQQAAARPAIKPIPVNPNDYGVIFLGYPNWWSSMPMPVYTFIEQNKLDGKTIAPFSTNGGGGLGHSIEDLKQLVPNSKILTPLAISGSRAGSAARDVAKWLKSLAPDLK